MRLSRAIAATPVLVNTAFVVMVFSQKGLTSIGVAKKTPPLFSSRATDRAD